MVTSYGVVPDPEIPFSMFTDQRKGSRITIFLHCTGKILMYNKLTVQFFLALCAVLESCIHIH